MILVFSVMRKSILSFKWISVFPLVAVIGSHKPSFNFNHPFTSQKSENVSETIEVDSVNPLILNSLIILERLTSFAKTISPNFGPFFLSLSS